MAAAAAEIIRETPEAVLPRPALARLLEVVRAGAGGDHSGQVFHQAISGLIACNCLAAGNPAQQLLEAGVPVLILNIVRWWHEHHMQLLSVVGSALSRLITSAPEPWAAALLAAPGDAVGTLLAATRVGAGPRDSESSIVAVSLVEALRQLTGYSPAAAARVAADRGFLLLALKLVNGLPHPQDSLTALNVLSMLIQDGRRDVAGAVADLPGCCAAALVALRRAAAAGVDENCLLCALEMLGCLTQQDGPCSAPQLAVQEVQQSAALPLLLRLCSHPKDRVARLAANTCFFVASSGTAGVSAIASQPAALPALVAAVRYSHYRGITIERFSTMGISLQVLRRCCGTDRATAALLLRLAPEMADALQAMGTRAAAEEEAEEQREQQQQEQQQQQQADAAPQRICAHCGAGAGPGGARLKRCRGCRAVRYCGEACADAAWRGHRRACKAAAAAAAAEAAARAVQGLSLNAATAE